MKWLDRKGDDHPYIVGSSKHQLRCRIEDDAAESGLPDMNLFQLRRERMPRFVIAMGAAPHMKLSRSGAEFSATEAPMAFDSHDAAYDYLVQHTGDRTLKGVRGEIIEDLAL